MAGSGISDPDRIPWLSLCMCNQRTRVAWALCLPSAGEGLYAYYSLVALVAGPGAALGGSEGAQDKTEAWPSWHSCPRRARSQAVRDPCHSLDTHSLCVYSTVRINRQLYPVLYSCSRVRGTGIPSIQLRASGCRGAVRGETPGEQCVRKKARVRTHIPAVASA
jgi:hypothetical protein